MTTSPNSPDRQPEPTSEKPRWQKILKRTSLTAGAIALTATAAGAGYAWYFIMNELAPLVSTQLTKLVQRPVVVGPVTGFSLSGITLGESRLPATPTDPDTATIAAVEVSFNLWQFLLTRTLSLDVTLVQPDLYLEQSIQGAWLETELNPGDEESGPISIKVDAIQFQNGNLVLVPNPQLRAQILGLDEAPLVRSFRLEDLEGAANFFDDGTRVGFKVTANPKPDVKVQRGSPPVLEVSGEAILTTLETKLRIQGNNLYAPEVMPLIPNLPIAAYDGRVNANLGVELRETELLGWQGTASFIDLTAKLGGLPQNLAQARGVLRFSGLKVGLEDASALYGEIPATAAGVIDTAGDGDYNLGIKILPVSAEKFIDSLDVNVPVDVTGELAGEMQVRGELQAPVVLAAIANTKPIAVDRVNFSAVKANVKIAVEDSQLTLTEFIAKPAAGGQITGSGVVPLEPTEAIALTFTANNIPSDAIAAEYLENPLPIALGDANAIAKISGSPENPTTVLQWALPQASYPARGEVIVLNDTVVVPNTRISIAGGTISANGSLMGDRWRGFVTAEGLQLDRLALPGQNPPLAGAGTLEARIQAEGSLEGDLDDITAVARASIDSVNGGAIAANARLNEGQWQATVNSSQLNLAEFIPTLPVPVEVPDATLNLAGTVDSLAADDLEATATAQLQVPGGSLSANARLDRGQWRLTATTDGLSLDPFVPQETLPVSVAIADARVNLAGNLDNSNLNAIAGSANVQLNVAGNAIAANAQLNQGNLQATVNAANVPLDPFIAQQLPVPVVLADANLNLSGNIDAIQRSDFDRVFATTDIRLNVAGNPLIARGQLVNGQLQATVNATEVPLNPLLPQPLSAPVVLSAARVNLAADFSELQPQLDPQDIFGTTQLQLRVAGAPVTANGRLVNGQFQVAVNASGVPLDPFVAQDLPVSVAVANGNATIAGNLESLDPAGVNAIADLQLDLGGAAVNANARVRRGNLQATLTANRVQLDRFAPDLLTVPVELASGRVNLSGDLGQLSPSTINATTQARLNVAGGTVVTDARVRNGNFLANFSGDNVLLSPFAPNLPVPIALDRGTATVSGNLDNLQDPRQLNLTTRLQLDVANADVNANATIRNGNFLVAATVDELEAQRFTNVPSTLEIGRSRITARGTIAALDPSAIAADVQAQLQIAGGDVNANATLDNGQLQALVTADGVRVNQFTALPMPVAVDRGELRVSGNIANLDPTDLNATLASRLNIGNADAAVNGTLRNGNFEAIATTTDLQVSEFAPNLPPTLNVGEGRLAVSGRLTSFDPQAIAANAELQLEIAEGAIAADATLRNGQIQAFINATGIQANAFAPDLPVPLLVSDAEVSLAGNLSQLQPTTLDAATEFNLLVANTEVTGSGFLENGAFQARLFADRVNVEQFAPDLALVPISDGRAFISGTLDPNNPLNSDATAELQLAVADGRVSADVLLNDGFVRADVSASGVQVNQIAADLPVLVQVADADVRFAGELSQLSPETLDLTGNAILNVAGGRVSSDFGISDRTWQAVLRTDDLPLNAFAPNLQEPLLLDAGTVALSGRINELSLAGITANGDAELVLAALDPDSTISPFASSISPLTSTFRWNGDTLQVSQLDAPGLNASGEVFVSVPETQTPQVTGFNFNVNLNDFNLAGLPLPVDNLPIEGTTPEEAALPYIAGEVDFSGQITGSLPAPNPQLPFDIAVVGDLRLEDLALATLDFEPVLAGPVRVRAGEGATIDVRGETDAIAVSLNENFFPESFLVRAGDAIARGDIDSNVLAFEVANFPLSLINPVLPPDALPVAGLVNTSGRFNLETQAASADFRILDPRIGFTELTAIAGEVTYNDNVAVLDSGVVQFGESEYAIEARAVIDEDPNFEGSINIARGQVEDVLQVLQLFTIADFQRGLLPPNYANPDAIDPVPVGIPDANLIAQLRRFSEITTLLQLNALVEEQPGVPELVNIQGQVGGEITFAGSVETGVEVGFNIVSDGLKWYTQTAYPTIVNGEVVVQEGRVININEVTIRGNFENGVVTFLPLRIQAEGSTIAFNGTLGGENQSGQLRVEQLSVNLIKNFVELPPNFDVNGLIDLRATLAGTLENPQAIGDVTLVDGTINEENIPSVRGAFSFANARLNFSSIEPANFDVAASVPIPPTPGNDEISLNVDIENEGLTLINIASQQQVEWVNGIGKVTFEARGNLNAATGEIEALVAEGFATIENATINAAALPEPLTNVNATARFTGDRIIVETASGDFSEGTVVAQGVLPIFSPLGGADPDVANPLAVAFNELELNFEDLYNGGVDGRVVITGTALEPAIGGEILLSDGNVLLPSGEESQTPAVPGEPGAEPPVEEEPARVAFNDLRVVLGDDIGIVSQPLLSFVARGDLTINGYLDDLRPRGQIVLERGLVNLFTTQFRLARGVDNVAVFTGSLDPYLDVQLVANVPEVTRSNLVTVASSSEVNDGIEFDIGRVRTVRVIASVQGPASELNDNLQLTSEPSRSEQEIVTLIGGGFINTFGEGNATVALADIAATTFLGEFQNDIAQFLGLSEFRLSPVMVEEGGGDRFALEAEAAVDITRNFSLSIERVLMDEMPTQFNVRYRISDRFMLRGSTDFDDNHRTLLEYQLRF